MLTELPFCENNKIKPQYFLKEFNHFTKNYFEVGIKSKTRQVKILLSLKK